MSVLNGIDDIEFFLYGYMLLMTNAIIRCYVFGNIYLSSNKDGWVWFKNAKWMYI